MAKSKALQASEIEVVDVPSPSDATNVAPEEKDDVELPEAAEEVFEEDFRSKCLKMPEDQGSNMAISFISSKAKSRDESHSVEDMRMTFDTVESMIKGAFP